MNAWDINTCRLDSSKHFMNKYMRRWNWDFHDLREALRDAKKIEKAGNKKYEAYVDKNVQKKIIFVYYAEFDSIYIISGAEGS